MSTKNALPTVVVGAGLAGLASALYLSSQGKKVILIEKEPFVGGMWHLDYNSEGVAFTQGVHIPELTLVPEIDSLIFGDIHNGNWHVINHALKEGIIFEGQITHTCGCVDTTFLSSEDNAKGIVDLLATEETPNFNEQTLFDQLIHFYGHHFVETVFRKIMQKYTGEALENLSLNMHKRLIPQRLRVGNAQLSDKLRALPGMSAKIGHASWIDIGNMFGDRFAYPKQGESQTWVDDMAARAIAMGTDLRLGVGVTQVLHNASQIEAVVLDDGTTLPCSQLVWTLPSAAFAKFSNFPIQPTSKMKFRDFLIVHLLVDGPVHTDDYYITDYDETSPMFRMTFIDNINQKSKTTSPQRVTFEMILDPELVKEEANIQQFVEQGIDYLRHYKIIDIETPISYTHSKVYKNILPVFNPAQYRENKALNQSIKAAFSNIVLTGRASMDAYLAPHIFKEVYQLLAPSKTHYEKETQNERMKTQAS